MSATRIEVQGRPIWVTAEPVRTNQGRSKVIQTIPNQFYGYYRYDEPAEAVPGNQIIEGDQPKIFATPEQVTEYVRSQHS
jgi:hypothetical protein